MFRKRILWHLPYALIGGVETLYKTILKYVCQNKYEHFVTCHPDIQGWVESQYPRHTLIKTFTDPPSLAEQIRNIDPDLIMGTHGMTLYKALDLCHPPYPVVEIVHGSHIWCEHNIHMPKHFTKHVICVSKSAEEVYLKNSNFGIPTSVIINGVDTEVFYPRKEFQTTARNFAYFGRCLESDKKVTKIIQAFRSLGTQHAKLYIIGGTPHEIITLKKFAQKLKLGEAVRFFGHTPHPEEFYKEVDIVTVRSEAEGYCNVVAEALASGCPVVCYNFGGILRHLDTGTVLVANGQGEYALHLTKVFRDVQLRKEMIAKGFKFIKSKGNAQIMGKAYEGMFEKILNGSTTVVKTKREALEIPYVGKVSVLGSSTTVGVANPHWHGIYTATRNCTDVVVNWHNDPSVLMKNILRHKPQHILFSGGCPGFKETARKIKKKYPDYPISSYYHGGVSHFSFAGGMYGQGERDALSEVIEAHREGIYKQIAVSSPGLAEIGKQVGIKFIFTGNIFKSMPIVRKNRTTDGINIGNFNRHLDHKHTSVGAGAAMLIPKATVHMLNCNYRIPFIDYSKVVFHPEMSQDTLYDLYQQMDVCLQLSFIETFNISVLEMWAHEVPVILGPGNYVLFKNNKILKELCGVYDVTNPVEIANKIQLCLAHKNEIIHLQNTELKKLNEENTNNWRRFFQ